MFIDGINVFSGRRETAGVLFVLLALVAACGSLAQGQEDAYSEMTSWMGQTKVGSGCLPGFSDMSTRMKEYGARITPDQQTRLWREWSGAQKPAISVEDMVKAAQARRAAVETARLRFTVEEEQQDEAGVLQAPKYRKEYLLMAPDGLKRESQEGSTPNEMKAKSVKAYDGTVVRNVYPTGSGGVGAFSSRSFFFTPGNPLAAQMLLDASRDLNIPDLKECDLENFLKTGYVLEATETVDGRKALVCTSDAVPTSVVWLDAERNFAVLRIQTNMIDWTDDGKVKDLKAVDVTDCTGFRDCGNGVWMPGEIRTVMYSRQDDSIEMRRTVKVEEAKINGDVAHSEFVEVFSPGMQIFDGVANKVYRVGGIEDADRQLAELTDDIKLDLQADTKTVVTTVSTTTGTRPAASTAQAGEVEGANYRWVWIACAALGLCVAGALAIGARRRGKANQSRG